MKDRTIAELRALDDSALWRYFSVKAKYSNQMPKGAEYFIRVGGHAVTSGDTQDLWQKFQNRVRKGQ